MQSRPTRREIARQSLIKAPNTGIVSHPDVKANKDEHFPTKRGIWKSGGDVFDFKGDVDMNDWGSRMTTSDITLQIKPQDVSTDFDIGTEGNKDTFIQRSIWSEGGNPFDANGDLDMNNWGTSRAAASDTRIDIEEEKIGDDVAVNVTTSANATTSSMTYATPTVPLVRPALPMPVSRLEAAPAHGIRMMASSFDPTNNVKDTGFGVGTGVGILLVIVAIVGIDFCHKRHPKGARHDPEGDAIVARYDAELAATSKSELAGHSGPGPSSSAASVRSLPMASVPANPPYPARDNVVLNVVLRKEAEKNQ